MRDFQRVMVQLAVASLAILFFGLFERRRGVGGAGRGRD